MDQFMVDVTDIIGCLMWIHRLPSIGKDGDEEITMERLAELCGGFHYEMVCDIGKARTACLLPRRQGRGNHGLFR